MTEAPQDNDAYSWFWTRLDQFLEEKGLKQTKQRRAIVQCFLDSATHLDAESLHQRVSEEGHRVGLATIYRTLNLLKEAGVVDEKQFGDGRSLFELTDPEDHHDHLICLDCGEVVEFENQEIEDLQHAVAKEHGFELANHRLDLYGRCIKANCPQKK